MRIVLNIEWLFCKLPNRSQVDTVVHDAFINAFLSPPFLTHNPDATHGVNPSSELTDIMTTQLIQSIRPQIKHLFKLFEPVVWYHDRYLVVDLGHVLNPKHFPMSRKPYRAQTLV